MKWPWSKRKAEDALDTASGKAIADAEDHLADVQAQWPEVHRVSSSLRMLREQNHFGDAIERLIRGGQA